MAEMLASTDLEIGARVMSADGKQLGRVKEIGEDRFKVDAHLRPDFWLGVRYVEYAKDGIVQMNVTRENAGAAKIRL